MYQNRKLYSVQYEQFRPALLSDFVLNGSWQATTLETAVCRLERLCSELVQSCDSYVSRSAREHSKKSWKYKGNPGNIKGHVSARMPLMFPNFKKSRRIRDILEN